MKRLVTVIGVLALAVLPGATESRAQIEVYQAVLSGANEVPANASVATGTVYVFHNTSTNNVAVCGSYAGLESNYLMSHIHRQVAGINGPIIVDLATAHIPNGTNAGSYDGLTVLAFPPADVDELQSGGAYVNVHSTERPGGEIRAQLNPVANTDVYQAMLSGVNEVPPNTSVATGIVYVLHNTATNNLVVCGSYAGLENIYTASHIHQGVAGVNAGVLINLVTAHLPNGTTAGSYDGVTIFGPLDSGGVTALQSGGMYLNVHSAGRPGGEIRDQLGKPTVLPVELTSFEARADRDAVLLTWTTATETNNAGFEVQHAATSGRRDVQLNVPTMEASPTWQPLAFVEGRGTTVEAQRYEHRVAGLVPGPHVFRLRQVDYDGAFAYSQQVEVTVGLPGPYYLSDVYPNPFNPQASFKLAVEQGQHVRITVHDALGRQVADVFNGRLEAGASHAFTVDGTPLSSGAYLLRVEGEHFQDTRPLTLVK